MIKTVAIATALTGATLAGAAAPAGAAITNTCIDFDYRFIQGRTASSVTVELPSVIPEGHRVTVEVWTSDSYEGRENTKPQPSERVRVLGVVSDDLADSVEAAASVSTGTAFMLDPLAELTVEHVTGDNPGPNSVQVDEVCLSWGEPDPVIEEHPPVLIPEPAPEQPGAPSIDPGPAPEPVAPAPTLEEECEDHEPCVPACPDGERHTRAGNCETILYCNPVIVPGTGYEYGLHDWDTVVPMSPTGLLKDCPTSYEDIVPVVVVWHGPNCIIF